jgi:hypothetical protein
MARPKGIKETHRRPRKPAAERRVPAPFRLRADLIARVEDVANTHGLPASLVCEILIARALESEIMEALLAAASVR